MKTKLLTMAICIIAVFSVDLAYGYHPISPYAYVKNNPVRYVDPDGRRVDDYYSSMNGKYLGTDGATTTNMRLIDERRFQEISTQHQGTISAAATSGLQGASTVITVNEGQIQ